ncbi:class F sortase [Streptomyces sp. NPDC003753]|uniref:class F sortase n=1 Tax=unclassified Streptomyces TaxID=2593676 RepID=UPI001908F4BC|nr:class F sortase [Streptomyces sp. Y2F8-2]GHK03821.1 class F sortase [Streptomyces sp. Y2F8-2]GHK04903.1 class F sortase [Streptomyces sp. Y2F8-2]
MSASGPAEGGESGHQRKRAPWGVIALVLLTGLALVRNGSGESPVGPPQPAKAAAPAPDSRSGPGSASGSGSGSGSGAGVSETPDPLPYSAVERVHIPALQIDAPVIPVGLDTSGWVAAPPPEDPNLAGWFTGAVSPGEKGTAVIVGHVDNREGPAVFYGLGALGKGHHIEVRRQDGRTAVFEVYGNEVVDKAHFPGDHVYGNKGAPELRVITCGGEFVDGNYAGNVVVFARMVAVR